MKCKILPAVLFLLLAMGSVAGHGNGYVGKSTKEPAMEETVVVPETLKATLNSDLTESPLTILLSL